MRGEGKRAQMEEMREKDVTGWRKKKKKQHSE